MLLAQSPYLDPDTAPSLPKITLKASVCNDDHALCIEKRLSTYDINESSFPAEMNPFRSIFAAELDAYYHDDIRSELHSILKDFPDITGNYDRHSDTSLFALTPKTLTLQYEQSAYSGGAHGSYTITYANFMRKDAKPVTLEMLLKKRTKAKLRTIAEHYYRLLYNIPNDKDMHYDGWFDNRFRLAETFAITPGGLLFVYNQYEIKPYADGLTHFFLPYTAIHDLIDPDGPIGFAANASGTTQKYTFKEDPLTLRLSIKRHEDFIDINATLQSDKCLRSGNWLSLSFPQLHSKKALLATGYTHFQKVTPYDTHNRIYHRKQHKSIPARYLLIEAEQPTICPNTVYSMFVRIKPPKALSPFIIDLRALSKTDDITYTAPYDYDGTLGQQGYQNYRVLFDL
jgi:hypothetical protein